MNNTDIDFPEYETKNISLRDSCIRSLFKEIKHLRSTVEIGDAALLISSTPYVGINARIMWSTKLTADELIRKTCTELEPINALIFKLSDIDSFLGFTN